MSQIYVENIPEELRNRPQWVLWRYEKKDGNGAVSKPPFLPDGNHASPTNPATWSTFPAIQAAMANGDFEGIGFVLTNDTPYTGIDIDHCRDADTGEIDQDMQRIIDTFASYTETTPSGAGIRVWIRGNLPDGITHKIAIPSDKYPQMAIEAYDQARYFTLTGNVLSDCREIADGQEKLDRFCRQYLTKDRQTHFDTDLSVEDRQILDRIRNSKSGHQFTDLWEGHGGNDDSANDLALCNMLAFGTGKDPAQMDRLFRQSGLYRDKWDERRGDRTYGQMTIDRAIADCDRIYDPAEYKKRLREKDGSLPNPFTGKILSLQELYDTAPPDNYLIEKLMHPGDLFILFGNSGSGKTFLAIDMLFALANGEAWAIDKFRVPRRCTCVYTFGEGKLGIPKRMKARQMWSASHGKAEILPDIYAVPMVPQLYDGEAVESVHHFIETIQEELGNTPIDLVVIDTMCLASLHADENSTKDANLIIQGANKIREELGAAVILVHHTNKQGGYRGNTAFRGAVDGMLEVKELGQHRFTLHCDKLKDEDYFPDIGFHLRPFEESAIVEWEGYCYETEGETVSGRILAVLSEEYPRWFTCKEIADTMNLKQQQINNTVKKMGDRLESQLKDPNRKASNHNPMTFRYHTPSAQQEMGLS